MTTDEWIGGAATRRRGAMWRSVRVSVLALVMLGSAACSGGSDGSAAGDSTSTTATALARNSDRQELTTTAGDDSSGEPSPDAEQQLTEALDELGDSYRFTHTITTTAGDSVHITGRRVSDSSSYRVEAAAETLEWVVTSAAAWVRDADTDEWVEAGAGAGTDPLAALATPLQLKPAPDGALAVYDADALTPGREGTVEVEIVFGEGSVTFTSTTAGLHLSTTLTADANLSPIVAPT